MILCGNLANSLQRAHGRIDGPCSWSNLGHRVTCGVRQLISSKKFSGKVTWTEPFGSSSTRGTRNTAKRFGEHLRTGPAFFLEACTPGARPDRCVSMFAFYSPSISKCRRESREIWTSHLSSPVYFRSSPVSSHSLDFPNSRLIVSKISAPIHFSPRST